MKSKVKMAVIVVALLIMPVFSGASNVVDVTEFILGNVGAINLPFTATEEPLLYQAVLTDFADPVPFLFLSLSITKGGTKIGSLTSPDTTLTFDVEKGASYFANVLGVPGQIPGTDQSAGLFNLKITAVPVPSALLLLGTGLVGLIAIRRRGR
jgi:hypothetical protein